MTAQAGDTFEFKRALRRELRQQRAALSPAARRRAAESAAAQIARTRLWRQIRHVAIYLEHGSELATAPLLRRAWRDGKRTYVPRIGRDRRMHFVEIRRDTPLRPNLYGIREPAHRHPLRPLRSLDLLLIPLVGFDARGYRLGTGGGYYDRALAHRMSHRPLCLGWAYSFQQVDAVPHDPWDQRLHGAVTEKGVLRWRTG